jgi:hypothetical protein
LPDRDIKDMSKIVIKQKYLNFDRRKTPSLEARNIRLVNIITYIIEESKLISENMSPNVIHC